MASTVTRDLSLIKRIAVSIVFAPLIIWLFLTGGLPLFLFAALITVVGQWELFAMFGSRVPAPHRLLAYGAGAIMLVAAYFCPDTDVIGIVAAVTAIAFVIEILTGGTDRMTHVAYTVFAALYPAAFMIYLLKIESSASLAFPVAASWMICFMIAIVWIFDSASYFAGRAFGKHPFFPSVSPKKTVEGFIGGIMGAVTTGIVFGMMIDRTAIVHFAALSMIIAIAGQAGDLSESIVKREMGVKDSSTIIPGHGGILDRFDSLFFAAPSVYFYLEIVRRLRDSLAG